MFIIHVKEVKKMRMKVEFATSRFPRYYNVLGVSLIKEAIKKSSQDYYKNLYFYKDKSNKTSKNFTYSFYIKGYEIDGEDFIVKDRVVMYLLICSFLQIHQSATAAIPAFRIRVAANGAAERNAVNRMNTSGNQIISVSILFHL